MAQKYRVELIREGVRELLQSAEIRAALEEAAAPAMAQLGDGYALDAYVGRNRVNVSISAETPEAIRENLRDNTILKAVGV